MRYFSLSLLFVSLVMIGCGHDAEFTRGAGYTFTSIGLRVPGQLSQSSGKSGSWESATFQSGEATVTVVFEPAPTTGPLSLDSMLAIRDEDYLAAAGSVERMRICDWNAAWITLRRVGLEPLAHNLMASTPSGVLKISLRSPPNGPTPSSLVTSFLESLTCPN